MSGFEGSFLGRRERIDDGTRLECGVCWWVYDPEAGDSLWQIPAGTAFSELPGHWRCPQCDAAQAQFMVLPGGEARAPAAANATVQGGLAEQQQRLLAAYRQVEVRMRDLPVYRDDLPLGILGPRRTPAGLVAMLYSPWCMNILLLAEESERLIEGSEREVALPSGSYRFVRGHLPGFGAVESCSLFSPMEDFDDGTAVEAVAGEALRALFIGPEPVAEQEERVDAGRRRFLPGLARDAVAGGGRP